MVQQYSDGEDQITPPPDHEELTELEGTLVHKLWHQYASGLGGLLVLVLIGFFIVDAVVGEAQGASRHVTLESSTVVVSPMYAGDAIEWANVWCADGEQTLTFTTSWLQMDSVSGVVVLLGPSGSFIKDDGCNSNVLTLTTPETLTPGLWTLSGVVIDGEVIGFTLAEFEIVERSD